MTWMAEAGPSAAKHRRWIHPIATCIVHYIVVTIVVFAAHDAMVALWSHKFLDPATTSQCLSHADSQVPFFVGMYALWLLVWRLGHTQQHRSTIFYEYTWLCNVTLVLGALGLICHRPIIATAHCAVVGIDQLFWYVDLLGWTLSGFRTFPIGVAKYLTWSDTSWATRITCTHHLWTIPVLVAAAGGVHPLALPLSVPILVTNVVLSRWMTPFTISKQTTSTTKYLNVNLSHELWRDIRFQILQINYDDPPALLYLFRLLWRWQLFNLMVFAVIYILSHFVYGEAPLC